MEYIDDDAAFAAFDDVSELLRIRDQFIREVQELSSRGYFKDWRLRELHLEYRAYYTGVWVGPRDFVNKAVLRCMPRVQYINGMHREDFLGPGPKLRRGVMMRR